MKRLFIAMAVSAAALLGGSAANAADNTVKAKAATDVAQQSTDFSSHAGQARQRSHLPHGSTGSKATSGVATERFNAQRPLLDPEQTHGA
jgi:hypothetical protein